MKYLKSKTIIVTIIIIIAVAGVVYLSNQHNVFQPNGSSSDVMSNDTKDYSNSVYSFSLKYPVNLKVSEFRSSDDSGDVVRIGEEDQAVGLQIFITPFDEDLTTLTVDRIKQDVPSLTVLDPQDVTLGSNGKGVAFMDGTGTTSNRQIWFVADKHLYQVTAPASFDGTLKSIMNTWTFF